MVLEEYGRVKFWIYFKGVSCIGIMPVGYFLYIKPDLPAKTRFRHIPPKGLQQREISEVGGDHALIPPFPIPPPHTHTHTLPQFLPPHDLRVEIKNRL